jgi:hypothetical protein
MKINNSGFFNTKSILNPLDFYCVIMKNIEKFTEFEKFTILRFFDKLADSSEFGLLCKSKLSDHLFRKRLNEVGRIIFSDNPSTIKINSSCYLEPYEDEKWKFVLGGKVIVDNLTSEETLKIYKDVNSAFSILKNRKSNK